MLKTNYHTHNELCEHAFGTVMDYASEAYRLGFDIIGMSDHAPFRGNGYGFRMGFESLNDYIEQVNEAKKKYAGKMDVKLGLEIEYLPDKLGYYEELYNKFGLEYLILGQHFFMSQNNGIDYVYDLCDTKSYIDYANSIKEALKTGYFSFVAHPDLIFVHDFPWDDNCTKACDIIIDSALKYNIPLELNANGVRKGISDFYDEKRYPYPHIRLFEMISKSKIPVMVNSDCHQLKELDDEAMKKAHSLIDEWNLVYKNVL